MDEDQQALDGFIKQLTISVADALITHYRFNGKENKLSIQELEDQCIFISEWLINNTSNSTKEEYIEWMSSLQEGQLISDILIIYNLTKKNDNSKN